MLLYSDVKTEVGGRVIDSDDLLTDAWFQRQITEVYAFIVAHSGGYWLKEEGTLTTVASTGAYSLASNCWIPLQMLDTTNRNIITPCDYQDEAFTDIDRSASGPPYNYYRIANCGVSAQPSAASVLSLASDNAADVTPLSIRVRGIVASQEVTASFTPTGTTAVSTTGYAWTHVYEINKSAAFTGTLTSTSNTATVTNLVLPPEPKFADFPWIRFVRVPAGAYAVRYPYIRKPTRVTQSTDRFEVPDELEEAVNLIFLMKAQEYYQEYKKAEATEAKAIAFIKDRMKSFKVKHGSFVKNQSADTDSFDFLTQVAIWNMP